MRFIFLMDPLHTVKIQKDTSFALMLGAYQKKHEVYYLPDGGITQKSQKLYFHVTEVVPQKISEKPFIEKKSFVLSEDQIDVLFIRSDPPFDETYLRNTWLLDLLPKHIPVINSPSGIRTVNEKIWATQFHSIIPKTLVGRNKGDILEFLSEEKNIVAKPTDGFGGQSVFHVKAGERNAKVILETLTKNWTQEIILQQYVKASQEGDKRILLLDGEPLGAVLRVHSEDDHRNNFFSGGEPQKSTVNKRDREIIKILKPELKKLGLYFVGIDIIGDFLIEVNVTSPTCLQEMNNLNDAHLESQVIGFSEKLVDQYKSKDRILA